eukprot:scaffold8085_cov127-Isochrysis_galbana.AAC.3
MQSAPRLEQNAVLCYSSVKLITCTLHVVYSPAISRTMCTPPRLRLRAPRTALWAVLHSEGGDGTGGAWHAVPAVGSRPGLLRASESEAWGVGVAWG